MDAQVDRKAHIQCLCPGWTQDPTTARVRLIQVRRHSVEVCLWISRHSRGRCCFFKFALVAAAGTRSKANDRGKDLEEERV